MKKLFLFTLVFMILISSTVHAQSRLNKDERQTKVAVYAAAQTATKNLFTLKTMFEEVRHKTKETKLKIRILLENKDDLSQDQLTHLKDSLIQIKHYQNNLEDTLGAMKTKNLAIRVAREARDFDQLLVLYNEILQIQETRMTDLRLLTEHLNQLLTTFSV